MKVSELIYLREGERVLRVRLDRAETSVGSDPTSHVMVWDPAVPDLAATLIDIGDGRFRLRDHTTGLVAVNGAPIAGGERDLENGDQIRVGSFDLQLETPALVPQKQERAYQKTVTLRPDLSAGDAMVTRGDKIYPLPPHRPFNVGQSDDNDLAIDDDYVSSHHCRIALQTNGWWIYDLDSKNGTRVNDVRVQRVQLPNHAAIQLGGAGPFTFERSKGRSDPISDRRFFGMVGESLPIQRIADQIGRFGNADAPVLITGETGSGKDLVARALHAASERRDHPFLALNCSELTPFLMESDLFGHMKGAFTGAAQDKQGAFESTARGTLFLDEIGELPLSLQPKLLRVLESATIRRVGGTREIPINTRIVAATHRNLASRVRSGEFREDLFHRLDVLRIHVPALRERPQDILRIARHFLETLGRERKLELTGDAEHVLAEMPWRGNVRELKNVLTRTIYGLNGNVIRGRDLQFSDADEERRGRRVRQRLNATDERRRIIEVLDRLEWNQVEAARDLGMARATLYDRMKRHGIHR